jgi:hypothetical protein
MVVVVLPPGVSVAGVIVGKRLSQHFQGVLHRLGIGGVNGGSLAGQDFAVAELILSAANDLKSAEVVAN